MRLSSRRTGAAPRNKGLARAIVGLLSGGMSFFESLLALLLAAVVLIQVARRLGLPYPAMLALAGMAVAFVPGAPTIALDPQTALALFIAPVLLDAAYDFPVGVASRLWRPLVVLAVVAVLATAAVVALIGWSMAGLPLAAAVVLGAIVAPPDAAAATSVLAQVALPKRTVAVLKGESLFNDATALLLFSGALALQMADGDTAGVALRLTLAAPGGVLFGIACGWAMGKVSAFVAGTLGGNLLQFINAFLVWIVAERLHLSAVLAVVACAMTVARSAGANAFPRMRVQSFAVWASVVFLLNVLAFLLMGMQARLIVGRMTPERLREAAEVAGAVVAGVVVARFVVVMAWNRASAWLPAARGALPPPTAAQGLVVGWAGMRGLLSLATAFALPASFPQRDVVVLTAFAVVIATLVGQGMTLRPLIRLLKLDQVENPAAELVDGRSALTEAALKRLEDMDGEHADTLRTMFQAKAGPEHDRWVQGYRDAGLAVVGAQRAALDRVRAEETVSTEVFYQLQEELDWRELTLLPEDERRIEEG